MFNSPIIAYHYHNGAFHLGSFVSWIGDFFCKDITVTNSGILSSGPPWINFCKVWSKISQFLRTKWASNLRYLALKMPSTLALSNIDMRQSFNHIFKPTKNPAMLLILPSLNVPSSQLWHPSKGSLSYTWLEINLQYNGVIIWNNLLSNGVLFYASLSSFFANNWNML